MKRFIALAITLAMIVSLIPAFSLTSSAASMDDATFFAKFDYAANPGLSEVKAYVDAADYTTAKAALLEYFKDRKKTSSISGYGITEADEFYGMAVLPMRNILTGPYEFDMWQAEFTVTSSSYANYEIDVTERIASELNNGAVSFMLFAGDKQQYPVYVKSKEAGSNIAPKLSVTYEKNGSRSTTTITADNDTYISSGNTSTTYGSATELNIKEDGTGSDSTGTNTRRAYLNFPLEVAANSTIISAKLVLNAAYAADCTTGDKDVLVINVGDTMWDEDSLTWAGTRGSIYSYQNATVPTWAASAPNADSEYHNVTSRFWFGKPMAYEYLSYLENPTEYNATHPYSDVYPGEDFGPKLVQLMDAFASQRAYGYTRTLETGERLNRWVDIVDAFLETDVFDTRLDQFCNILSFMWGDCNYLAGLDISNGSYWWSNWRIVANAGFFKAVEYLPEFTTHDTWREKVEYNVEYTFDLLYNNDYSFTEAGPSYAVWCVKLFGDCLKAADMSGNSMSAVFREKVKYATRNALESYYPNGYDTNIGDSNYRNQMHYFEMLNGVFGEKDAVINSYVSGTDMGAEYLTRYYDTVNSAYMRNSWNPDEAVYINFTNNPADGHYHPDSNQIVMYAYGAPLLVDSGRYSYSSTNSIYDTLRTAASHNTIEADGLTLGAHSAAASANALTYANANGTFDFATSTQNGYSNVAHTRNVFFNHAGFGIVTDYVAGSTSRAYRQNWHFMPSSNATVSGTVAKTAFYNAPDITLAAASADSASIKSGYHSADYGLVAESEYASFQKSGTTVKFDTVLYPDEANVNTAVTVTDLAASDTSKAALQISIDGETSYYYVKNTSSADGTFGSYSTDAKMAYVSGSEYMIADGKEISGKVESASTIVSMGVTMDNGVVTINGEKLVADSDSATAIKIYAPNTTTVIFNGEEISFTKSGNYIYAVSSAVGESVTGAVAKVYPDKDGFYASSGGNEGASQTTIIQAARSWQNRNAYMAFDLSDFKGKEITSAVLKMLPTEVANSPSNLHFYYLDYGTWTRSDLSFVLDSSKMPSHTNTSGGFTGYSYRWSGSVSSATVGNWVSLESNLPSYLAANDNYKFTWAILAEAGSIKFNSLGAAEANRPYLEVTYNYQTSSEGYPTVTIKEYRDGVLYSTDTDAGNLGEVYLYEAEDEITSGSTTYYIDTDKSKLSAVIQKSGNVIEVYYKSSNTITVNFEDVSGNELSDSVTVNVNPNLTTYTYAAPASIEVGTTIYKLVAESSDLVWNKGDSDDVLTAVYKKSSEVGETNLISNGSFEDEDGNFSLEGWNSASTGSTFGSPYSTNHCYAVSATGITTNNSTTSMTNTIPDGNWAFGSRWNDGTDGLCSIKRYVPVESGKTYLVTYDTRHKTGSAGTYIRTSFVGSSGAAEGSNYVYPSYVGTEWQTFSTTFTATDDTDYVLFWFRWLGDGSNSGNGPFWYFDNFQIREIVDLENVTVTFDGEQVTTDGTIALGVKSGANYTLPDNVIGYNIESGNETSFVSAGTYTVKNGDVITTIPINVSMVTGAQVRYGGGLDENNKVSSGNGLRFIAQVDRSYIGEEVTGYGMEISAEGSSQVANIPATKWQDSESQTIFTAALTDLATSNYNRNFTATPYVNVKYTDGTTAKVYSTQTITRSIYQVAVGLLKNSSDAVDGGDTSYDTTNYGLYDVLNAYVNMVGVRLTLTQDGTVTARTEGSGAYTGDVFFNVTSEKKSANVYTITVSPITENFNNSVTIMSYWNEFIRINNNNSVVKQNITNSVINSDGSVTFDFTVPATN
ncbi:MAG: DNRLRE domain-containing protein [Clostridia bacterium]|nr:DNRLRE domain-containing protein [Clostridia bacterium]